MRNSFMRVLAGSAMLLSIGCNNPAINTNGNSGLTIQSVVAIPTIVPPGESAMIKATVTGASGAMNYEWNATGAYEYLSPRDSICIFSSPGCHSGPATVTVTVTDASGATATDSVKLN